MSDTKERKLVDVSALIAGDVQFVQIHVWTEAKGLHMVKLRVVEEVEWDEVEDRCLNCGFGNDGNYVGTNYCPGCGNKIKRP